MPTFDVGSSSESISGYSGSTTGSSSNFSLSGRSKESDKGSSSNTGDNNDSESTVSTSSEKEKEKGTETANPVSSGGSTKKDVRKEVSFEKNIYCALLIYYSIVTNTFLVFSHNRMIETEVVGGDHVLQFDVEEQGPGVVTGTRNIIKGKIGAGWYSQFESSFLLNYMSL